MIATWASDPEAFRRHVVSWLMNYGSEMLNPTGMYPSRASHRLRPVASLVGLTPLSDRAQVLRIHFLYSNTFLTVAFG